MKQLIVKNFGPIKDATIELKNYNFFIGGQGVGKSTLAKLISIFTDFRLYWDMYWTKDDITVWRTKLLQYNIADYLHTDTYISLEYTLASDMHALGEMAVTFCYKDSAIDWNVSNQILDNTVDNSKEQQIVSLLAYINKQAYESFNEYMSELQSIKAPSLSIYDNFILKASNSFQNVLYIPAERILFSMLPKMQSALSMVDQSIPKMFLFYSIMLNEAKSYFKTYHVDMLSLDYVKKGDEDIVMLDNGRELPLNTTSSGMQSLIPLLLTLDYSILQKGFHSYVVEEPECNLFPDNQCLLIDNIVMRMDNSGIPDTTVTVTTHSPYIINYLNVLMRRVEKSVEKPGISSDSLSVYMIHEDGTAENLMSIDNNTGLQVVNTFVLTEKMQDLYAEYSDLS